MLRNVASEKNQQQAADLLDQATALRADLEEGEIEEGELPDEEEEPPLSLPQQNVASGGPGAEAAAKKPPPKSPFLSLEALRAMALQSRRNTALAQQQRQQKPPQPSLQTQPQPPPPQPQPQLQTQTQTQPPLQSTPQLQTSLQPQPQPHPQLQPQPQTQPQPQLQTQPQLQSPSPQRKRKLTVIDDDLHMESIEDENIGLLRRSVQEKETLLRAQQEAANSTEHQLVEVSSNPNDQRCQVLTYALCMCRLDRS